MTINQIANEVAEILVDGKYSDLKSARGMQGVPPLWRVVKAYEASSSEGATWLDKPTLSA